MEDEEDGSDLEPILTDSRSLPAEPSLAEAEPKPLPIFEARLFCVDPVDPNQEIWYLTDFPCTWAKIKKEE